MLLYYGFKIEHIKMEPVSLCVGSVPRTDRFGNGSYIYYGEDFKP